MDSIRKRLAALSLAAVSLLQLPLVGSAAEQEFMKGDVTLDGYVTSIDSFAILRYMVGLDEFSDDAKALADIDGDGHIGLIDASLVSAYSVGLISDYSEAFPEGVIKYPESVLNAANGGNNNTNTNSSDTDTDSEPPEETKPISNGFGDNATEDSSITVSGTSYSVPAGMTLYVTGASGVTWGSTNTDIATVDSNGLVLAKKEGTVRIIALKGNKKRTINLTVTSAEPVRTVYSSPNSAVIGSTVKFIATTDQTRTGVRFDVNINGNVQSVTATEKVADNSHGIYTWTGTLTTTAAGTFDVTAYSEKDGSWKTCDNGCTTMFVSDKTSVTEPSLSTLRASDNVIQLIAQYEGGISEAEYDPLAYGNVMNYGYGVTISAGTKFYNRASMSEYFADLVNQVNENVYSKYVNSFLQTNSIKYNQYQFDSLVCFTYNLGVNTLQNASLKSILLNCYEPSSSSNSSTTTASVTASALNVRSGAGTNYSVLGTIPYGSVVTVLDSTMVNGVWVKVKTSSGLVGYCSSNYLSFGTSSGVRNFNYINKNALITEVLAYHHAGGVCYWGLLYRRIDELELFIYGDYTQDGSKNKYGWTYPTCIASGNYYCS